MYFDGARQIEDVGIGELAKKRDQKETFPFEIFDELFYTKLLTSLTIIYLMLPYKISVFSNVLLSFDNYLNFYEREILVNKEI